MPVPAVLRIGNSLLISGPALLDADAVMRAGVEALGRRNGRPPSPRRLSLTVLVADAAADIRAGAVRDTAAMSPSPAGHVPVEGDLPPSEPRNRVTTKEAAVIPVGVVIGAPARRDG